MPINLTKAKNAIEKYRTVHTLLHQNPPIDRLGEAHDPLTIAMRTALQKWGFAHEDEVFIYSNNEVLNAMGYSSKEVFFLAVYDNDGNVIPGNEDDHNTWEARWM